MAIYIESLDLPKDRFYPIHATIYADGSVFTGSGVGKFAVKAIEVSPHGDLIDRNALIKGEGRYIISFGKEGIDVAEINRAPTIIPASKEGGR